MSGSERPSRPPVVVPYRTIGKKESESIDVSGRTCPTVGHGTISLVAHCESYKGVGIFRWRISSLRVPTLVQDFSETFKCLTSTPLVFHSHITLECRRVLMTPTMLLSLVARGEFNVYQLELFLSVY